jgi:hypothetical protein
MWERWKCVLRRQKDEDKTEREGPGSEILDVSLDYGASRIKCLFSREGSPNKRQQQAVRLVPNGPTDEQVQG